MKKINIELKFDDDFEPEDCSNCPLSYEESWYDEDDGWDSWNSCVMSTRYDECWLRDKFNIK